MCFVRGRGVSIRAWFATRSIRRVGPVELESRFRLSFLRGGDDAVRTGVMNKRPRDPCAARALGNVWALTELWKSLGFSDLRRVFRRTRRTTDVEALIGGEPVAGGSTLSTEQNEVFHALGIEKPAAPEQFALL